MASMAALSADADQDLYLPSTDLTSGRHQAANSLGRAGATTDLQDPWNIPKLLAIMAGSTFAVASAATNLTYAIARADGLAQQITWGSVAVAASVALALAPSAVVSCLSQRKPMAAALAMTAVLMFGAYSVTAALGAATGGRMVNELEASDVAAKRKDAAAARAAAEKELAALPPSRPL